MYSSNPASDANAHYSALDERQERQEAAERHMAEDFLAAIARGDVTAKSPFGGQSSDWHKRPDGTSGWVQRPQQVWEDMFETAEYGRPSIADVMQILADAANGQDVRGHTKKLIEQMAWQYAQRNAQASHED